MKTTTATIEKNKGISSEAFVDAQAEVFGRGQEQLIPLLQAIQEHYRYLPETALRRICEVTEITPADVLEVSTFYSQFRLKPVGKHIIRVCHGTACHVKGAKQIDDALARVLKLKEGEDTDPDGMFTIQPVACLGCCSLAPVIQIDEVVYGHLATDKMDRTLDDFLTLQKHLKNGSASNNGKPSGAGLTELRITLDSCCVAGGTQQVHDALQDAVRRSGACAVVRPVGCSGMCHQIPLVEVAPPQKAPTLYAHVKPEEAERIVRKHCSPPGPLGMLKNLWTGALDHLLTDTTWEPITRYAVDVRDAPLCSYIGPQKPIATEHFGTITPLEIDQYIERDGFTALQNCLDANDPEAIVRAVTESGLRGRGGAGFPTGIKWGKVRGTKDPVRYIICNGDEGDPGAFMDRMLLESFPYRVLEGMAIAAFAVGANEGYLYIRAEYPQAVRNIQEAIRRCEAKGLLGERIMGTDFSLHLRVVQGAGAFVCGEETALIASIEGRRGVPRLRPPYPAEQGLWNRPTCINNVETYASVPWILRNGAQNYAALGTEKSKGTKVFSVAGRVVRGGLIEVPMGVTIRQVVNEICGGVGEGHTFKAVQMGGPSGGCIPASLADTPIDYEALQSAGAIMGSGGMVVLDDRDCMVDIARYFLDFTQKESCGQCTMCRVGTRRLLDILERLCRGEGRKDDLDKLDDLAEQVKIGSMCGLGQTAPNPVLTTLRYFRNEYEAHIQGHCPAGRCAPLIHYRVNDDCFGCTRCAQVCPVGAITLRPMEKHAVDDALCTRCDACRPVCPVDAIKVV